MGARIGNLASDLAQIENLLGVAVTAAGLVESFVGHQPGLGLTIAAVAAGLAAARNAVGDVLASKLPDQITQIVNHSASGSSVTTALAEQAAQLAPVVTADVERELRAGTIPPPH